MAEQQSRVIRFLARAHPSFVIIGILVGLAVAPSWSPAKDVVGRDVDIYGQPLDYIEQPEDKWTESPATIPAYPRDEDLLAVKLPERFTIQLFVDGSTIEVGKDGVARMTVVVRPKGGTANVFYEGFRCATVEHKTYAYASSEKQFKAMSKPEWQTLPYPEMNNYLRRLFHDYICADDISARPAREIARLIEAGEFPADSWFYTN